MPNRYQSVRTGNASNSASSATDIVPLLELDASSMISGASMTGSAKEPAVAVVVNAANASSVIIDFILSPNLC